MSRSENAGRRPINSRPLQLPSIEVTSEDGRTQTEQTTEPGSMHTSSRLEQTRRNRNFWRLVARTSWKGALSIIPHSITGFVLLAVGGVLEGVYSSPPDEDYTALRSRKQVLSDFNNQQDQSSDKPCDSVTCSLYLPLMCIAVGSTFIFCAISGVLMAMKMKEFASCHLIWISLSALSSVTLLAACVVGLNRLNNRRHGVTVCISVIITATTVEMVICITDLCLMTVFNNGIRRLDYNSASDDSRSRHSEALSGRDHDSREILENEDSSQRVTQLSGASRPRSPRPILRTGHNPRRRRSGQAIRDRNSLHPGYHHQGRSRARRRPVLRAQNHYVLVPAAYGRSRASSRVARRQSAGRRNRVDMPTFVLSNHDTYVQALNQSIEALETQPNRGSVPGDVLPSLAVRSHRIEIASNASMRKALEKTDSLDTNLSFSSVESSRIIHPVSKVVNEAGTPQSQSQQPQQQLEDAGEHPSPLRGSGYSVSRRAQAGFNMEHKTYGSETDAECGINSSLSSSLHAALPSNNRRPVSAMEDSVFHLPGWERSGSSQCMTDSEFSIQRREEIKPPIPKRTGRGRFYNAASEGDFTVIRQATKFRSRMEHTSVSSDSGIADAPNGAASKFCRSHYRNIPVKISPVAGIEMTDMITSNSRFHHSPVSVETPSYENLNSKTGAVTRNNFAFAIDRNHR